MYIITFPQPALLHFQIIPSNDQSSITVRMVLSPYITRYAEEESEKFRE